MRRAMNTRKTDDERSNTAGGANESRGERRIALRDNRIDSTELFAATREITISHGAETYRLRVTAQNKLILTK